jgi:hypothetical protein
VSKKLKQTFMGLTSCRCKARYPKGAIRLVIGKFHLMTFAGTASKRRANKNDNSVGQLVWHGKLC